MDGLEFLDKVRTELKRTELPIIIISTKGADEDIQKGMSLGATGYLSKPIQMTRLRELVSSCLEAQV
jgi:CheY-like chemotaxis protein